MKDELSLKRILGLPFVPPGKVARFAIRFRGSVLRSHRGMGPPAVRVLEGLFGLFDNRALGIMVQLEIPELLERPLTLAELAARTGSEPDPLDRVMRYLAGRGFVDETKGGYAANEVTEVLRKDHPNSWAGWVSFASSDWFWEAFRQADRGLTPEGVSGMEAAHGKPFFRFLTEDRPDAGDSFDQAMQAGATMQALALSHGLDWRNVETVCDVGGGNGAALSILLQKHAGLSGLLFDLPEVVEKAPETERLTTVGGNFFEQIPAGSDRYLLLAVIHDWNDDEAVNILQNLRSSMSDRARAYVVENVLPEKARGEFVEASDLLMFALGSGRERSKAGFETLFTRAGLSLEKTHVLPTGFSAFELSA